VTTRGSERLRVEAPVLISVTTALRFYGFPPALPPPPPPIKTDNSRCACCRRLAGMRSGIREDYGMHTRYICVRTRWRWRHDIVDDHSGCQISSSASRKFLKNGDEYLDFFACRPGYGYVNAAARAATNVKTSVLCLMAPLVSRFTRDSDSVIVHMYIHARIANTFHASLWS